MVNQALVDVSNSASVDFLSLLHCANRFQAVALLHGHCAKAFGELNFANAWQINEMYLLCESATGLSMTDLCANNQAIVTCRFVEQAREMFPRK